MQYLFVWNIPYDVLEEFMTDWKSLTEENKKRGLLSATLFVGEGLCVSTTVWVGTQNFNDWRENFRDLPARQRWRKYQLQEPEVLLKKIDV